MAQHEHLEYPRMLYLFHFELIALHVLENAHQKRNKGVDEAIEVYK